jgi:signal transduction histidine kinase
MPDRYRRTLVRGTLFYRWVALAWVTTLAVSDSDNFRNLALLWGTITLTGVWTLWLTIGRSDRRDAVLWVDLALSGWLTLVSGLVVPAGEIITSRPFFATGYPLSTVLLWGVERGSLAGAVVGLTLSAGVILARPINEVALGDLPSGEAQNLVGTVVNYFAAGAAIGLVTRLLTDSARAAELANDQLVQERERAARLAERESLARQIHDSVLQSLALVHKRGRELGRADTVSGDDVEQLAEIAGRQEAELRALILREPEEHSAGTASLRDALEEAGREIEAPKVTVSTVGALWLERRVVDEITAAVRQALNNVVEHAGATRASVFAESNGGRIAITVRDDGTGFVYDEQALMRDKKAGMLKSMKGRIEDLGGTMTVQSSAGIGTEIDFVVPVTKDESD